MFIPSASRVLKNQNGTSIVLFALIFTILAGFAALSIDVGSVSFQKSKLSSTLDAAALAGAQELITDEGNTENVVNNYIGKNDVTLKQTNISIDPANRTVEVSGSKTVDYFFARIFGLNTKNITGLAKAKVENIKSLEGARPFAVIQQTFVYGQQYTLKEGAGDGTSGNYAAIALGGTGQSNYRDNMLDGFDGTLTVGDLIQTETGNMSGTTETTINQLINNDPHSPLCTFDSYVVGCPRIIFIPVVDTLDISGRKYVRILGFATFFLENVADHGGQADVTGRFITYNMQGETASDINDYGTYGIRLIK